MARCGCFPRLWLVPPDGLPQRRGRGNRSAPEPTRLFNGPAGIAGADALAVAAQEPTFRAPLEPAASAIAPRLRHKGLAGTVRSVG